MAVSEAAVGEAARVAATGAALSVTGPLLSDYAVLAVFGLLGAVAKIANRPEARSNWSEALWAIASGVSLAVLFGYFSAGYLARTLGQDPNELLWPIAGVLGMVGKDWPEFGRWVAGKTPWGKANVGGGS